MTDTGASAPNSTKANMILFHRTTEAAATEILASGFRDAPWRYMTTQEWSGVWLSNSPLDVNEGANGPVLLRVTLVLAETDLDNYEWVEEGKTYREWLVPAELVNSAGTVEIIEGG